MEWVDNLLTRQNQTWKYAANYWLRNQQILSSGTKSNAVLFVKYKRDTFTLMIISKRHNKSMYVLIQTEDFQNVRVKKAVLEEDRLLFSIRKFDKFVQDYEEFQLELDTMQTEGLLGKLDINPMLHESWKLFFKNLIELPPTEINTFVPNLGIKQLSPYEIVLYDNDSEKCKPWVTAFVNKIPTSSHEYWETVKDDVKKRMIAGYWDREATRTNFERRRLEDVTAATELFNLSRAELSQSLLKFANF